MPTTKKQVLDDFKNDLDRMIDLYERQKISLAENLRDELSERLDNVMRLGSRLLIEKAVGRYRCG